MTAELKGIHAKTFQDLDVIKDVLKLDEEKIAELEKENAELLEKLKNQKADYETYYKSCYNAQKKAEKQLTKAKEIIHKICYEYGIYDKDLMEEAKQFLQKDKTEQEEPYYVIVNMNCQYEICRKCPKSGLFKGTYEECEKWIKEKLRKVEK